MILSRHQRCRLAWSVPWPQAGPQGRNGQPYDLFGIGIYPDNLSSVMSPVCDNKHQPPYLQRGTSDCRAAEVNPDVGVSNMLREEIGNAVIK